MAANHSRWDNYPHVFEGVDTLKVVSGMVSKGIQDTLYNHVHVIHDVIFICFIPICAISLSVFSKLVAMLTHLHRDLIIT